MQREKQIKLMIKQIIDLEKIEKNYKLRVTGILMRKAKAIKTEVVIYGMILKGLKLQRNNPLKGHAMLQIKLIKKSYLDTPFQYL